jgi:competence protein ComEC
MWTLALIALQTGRRSYVWVSLALVAAAMVCWRPLLLWDTGFQLSVAGTAGIVLFADSFERPLHRLPPFLRESVAVTLAAQVATLPITAIGFGQISLIGPVANGLLLPLLGPIMALGAGCAALGALMPTLTPWLGYLLHPWLVLFIAAVRLLASLPSASLPWPVVPLALVAPYYALLLVLARIRVSGDAASPIRHGGLFAPLRGWPRSLRVALVPSTIACGLWLARPSGEPTLYLAGVGRGQALLLQTPTGQALLIDGGDTPAATQSLLGGHLPFWQRSLTAVLVTEPDRTHIGGLLGLAGLYHIDRAYDPGSIYPSRNRIMPHDSFGRFGWA